MKETRIYGVVLPVKMAVSIRAIAALQGKSRSRFIRDLIEEHLLDHAGQYAQILENIDTNTFSNTKLVAKSISDEGVVK